MNDFLGWVRLGIHNLELLIIYNILWFDELIYIEL